MPLYELAGVKVKTPGPGRFWVAQTAAVIGNVELGDDVSIWFGTTIRGDNDKITIGAGTNVQDNCILHVDPGFPIVIGENVSVGHGVTLHGCTIGRGSLIGMGAIILNGAVVGEGCLIGAGALIPEGKVIPPHSVVMGAPGKVVREVTEADKPRISRGAVNYRAKWREYAAGLKVQQ